MMSVPRDLQPLVSFFQLAPLFNRPAEFEQTIARIHGLTLLAMNYLQTSVFENHLLTGNRFLEAYRQVMAPKENGSDEASPKQLRTSYS